MPKEQTTKFAHKLLNEVDILWAFPSFFCTHFYCGVRQQQQKLLASAKSILQCGQRQISRNMRNFWPKISFLILHSLGSLEENFYASQNRRTSGNLSASRIRKRIPIKRNQRIECRIWLAILCYFINLVMRHKHKHTHTHTAAMCVYSKIFIGFYYVSINTGKSNATSHHMLSPTNVCTVWLSG